MRSVVVTGVAGFIGMHAAKGLLNRGWRVLGVDFPHATQPLPAARLVNLRREPNFEFVGLDLAHADETTTFIVEAHPDAVVHLAAETGVRRSLEKPALYIRNNVVAFSNVLEGCRRLGTKHLVYASSSSVYGANPASSLSESGSTEFPLSPYAATKRANELLAYSYARSFGFPATGMRFFTVYGPWGRPDMAYFLFTKAILAGEPIRLFNGGAMKRDFTHVDDVVDGIIGVLDAASGTENQSLHRVYNVGSNRPVGLLKLVELIEGLLGRKAIKTFAPLQAGDMVETCADTGLLHRDTGYTAKVSLELGLSNFVDWYRSYFAHQ